MNTFIWISGLVFALLIVVVALAMIVAAIEVRREQKEYLKKYERRTDDTKRDIRNLMLLLPVFIFMSCSITGPEHYQRIHGLTFSGTYTVKSVKNNAIKFKEFPGEYVLDSDTMKPGDRVTINVLRRK